MFCFIKLYFKALQICLIAFSNLIKQLIFIFFIVVFLNFVIQIKSIMASLYKLFYLTLIWVCIAKWCNNTLTLISLKRFRTTFNNRRILKVRYHRSACLIASAQIHLFFVWREDFMTVVIHIKITQKSQITCILLCGTYLYFAILI